MMRRICLIIMLLLAALLSGCGGSPAAMPPQMQPAAYTAVDDTGRRLSFSSKPVRIVSLTYGTDEILTDLVESGRIRAYSRWAGDNGISFITKEQLFAVGCKAQENLEAILAIEPDLVVASTATDGNLLRGLENSGVRVYVAKSPHNYGEMKEKVINLAAAVGEQAKGEELLRQMDARMEKLQQKLNNLPPQNRKVAVAFNFTSAMGRRGDLLDSMLTMAHVINGAAAAAVKQPPGHGNVVISKEMVVLIDPDVFLLPTWNYNNQKDVAGYANMIMNDPAYRNVKAVRNRQLKFVSDKYRYVASHHIVDAVENIARTIYPELF